MGEWFARTYPGFTDAQSLCIPAILDGRSVILSSPTGSGKTLAGFLGIIDRLVREAPPAGRIHALYVSPLRSLTYDIQKNLTKPLREMGLQDQIRVALRTGDTPAKDRAAIKRRPPHILLTTPETLAILLAQPSWHDALAACRYVVVDELHSIAENKRGAHLSLSLERLDRLNGHPTCRVGLSATVSPMEAMAAFLVGPGKSCVIAEARNQRRAIIEVFSPVRRNPYPPAGISASRVMHELGALIQRHRSVLIFTNTRAGAEGLGIHLKSTIPKLADRIEVHHGSLDRDLRLNVEDRLKNGELRAVVCSTSLEMGVDIGAIDLVIMIAAPKGISRALQRIGRSGHSVNATSHGILVATNVIDLVECAVTARLARERRLDPVHISENSADVLAQHIVGMALEEPGMALDVVYETVRKAWGYRELNRLIFDRIVEYLEGGGRSLEQAYAETFGKIHVDADRSLWPANPRVGREYLLNVGTIASEGAVAVNVGRRSLGTIDEYFMKGLKPGDVFVLGGRVVRVVEPGWQSLKVEAADGAQPNVPSWSANRLPMTPGLAAEVARLRGEIDDRLEDGNDVPATVGWLVESWEFSAANAQAVYAQFALQRRVSRIPRDGLMLIELYRETLDGQRLLHYFFHTLGGRSVNDALSRLVSRRVAGLVGGNALITADDYGFLLTLQHYQELDLAQWRHCFSPVGAAEELRLSLRNGELVRGQFRGVAQTGLMVPRQYPGRDRAIKQLRFSTEILFRVLEEHEPDHPLLAEAYEQAITLYLDFPGAQAWMERTLRPPWQWELRETTRVSPFAFSLFVARRKESMMFDDPDLAVERLYREFYGGEEDMPLADP